MIPKSPVFRSVTIVLLALMVTLVMFAPRLWLLTEYRPGTFQWDRGHTYLQQCADPFRNDIEPAMRWRLGPPLIAHFLRLPGYTPFLLPVAGVLFLLGFAAQLLRRRTDDWSIALAGSITIASTSAVLVPLHWLGLNDAWVWAGLLAAAFARHRATVIAAFLLAPWVDERFFIGLPLALIVRYLDERNELRLRDAWMAFALLPYVFIRLTAGGNPLSAEIEQSFIRHVLQHSMPRLALVHLAWWMGLRAAWIPIVEAFRHVQNWQRFLLGVVFAATAIISFVLASDMSRSAAIVLPVVVLGLLKLGRQEAIHRHRWCWGVAILSLLLPAMHVVHLKLDPINNLAVELLRLAH